MCLSQVPTWLIAELAINFLEDDACRVVMELPEEDWASLKQFVTCLEGLFGENVTIPELRRRFFVHRQQEDKSLTHFAVALQNLWKHREKKDVSSCANITTSDYLPRDLFVVGMKAGSVRRALQERIKA